VVLRFLILSACVLVIGGCGPTTPQTVSPEAVAKVKTIGVISSLGTAIHYERVGAGGWDNDFYATPGTQLGIDPYVVGVVGKQLIGRFDVKPVAYNPADFVAGEDDTYETMALKIRSRARPGNLDAYLLVLAGNGLLTKTSQAGIDFSNQPIAGLGLTRKSSLTTHDYWAHALYVVVMIDGHTGKVLSATAAPGGYQELGLLEVPKIPGPYRDVDETYWPEDPEHPASALVAKLIDGSLKPLFAESVPKTLKEANLLPQ